MPYHQGLREALEPAATPEDVKRTFTAMRLRVDRRLRSFAVLPRPTKPATEHALFASGNRMRPILYLATVGAIRGRWDSARDVALACLLELFHKSSLVLDDIFDDDDVRKGKPTVNALVGKDAAYLVGVSMLITCYDRLLHQVISGRLSHDEADLVRRAIRRTLAGQVADMHWTTSARDRGAYFALARRKTAALARLCVELAADRASATPAVRGALSAYAEDLGLGYQILNDVKGINGAERASGRGDMADLLRDRPSIVEVIATERGICRELIRRGLAGCDPAVCSELVQLACREGLATLSRARSALAQVWTGLHAPYREALLELTDHVARAWKDTDWDLQDHAAPERRGSPEDG